MLAIETIERNRVVAILDKEDKRYAAKEAAARTVGRYSEADEYGMARVAILDVKLLVLGMAPKVQS